jgi:ATP-dependent RNA helicase DeaD
MSAFKKLGLPQPITQALEKIGFTTPTPIQDKAIPIILSGKDLIGSAQTGTGKTGAFGIPTLAKLLSDPKQNALVLVPTRELALQIEEFWSKLTHFSKEMRSVTLIGGVAMTPQHKGIKANPRMIIATPGRLVDHLERKSISLGNIGVLILDEADRMLDMGFAPQLNEILRHVPKKRQTLFFTATWDQRTNELSKKFLLGNVERVAIGETSKAATTITQTLYAVNQEAKRDVLLEELNAKEGTILVFVRTQHRADRVSKYLASYGVKCNRLHGGRTQGQRTSALNDFRTGKIRVLVATDIAARGIDVAEIAHVVNYDLPQVAEDYIHRIGRTGRAGATGTATSFVTKEDLGLWQEIAKLLKKTGSPVPVAKQAKQTRAMNALDSVEEIEAPAPAPLTNYTTRGRDTRNFKDFRQNTNAANARPASARNSHAHAAKPIQAPKAASGSGRFSERKRTTT